MPVFGRKLLDRAVSLAPKSESMGKTPGREGLGQGPCLVKCRRPSLALDFSSPSRPQTRPRAAEAHGPLDALTEI